MEDKRRYTRWQVAEKIFADWGLATRVNYRIEDTQTIGQSRCTDISTMGMKVLLNQRLPKASFIQLKIDLPNDPLPVFARGEVIWQRQTAAATNFEAGIYFSQIKDSDKDRIYNFILHWGRNELVNRWWQGVDELCGKMKNIV